MHKWIMAGLLIIACSLGIGVIIYQALTAEGDNTPSADEWANFVVDAAAAQELYSQNCLSCHGVDFEGGPAGPALTNVGDQMERPSIARKIKNGGGGMPAFGTMLNDDQINNLAVWLSEQTSSAQPNQPGEEAEGAAE